ncbi:hypothetical protein DD594_25450 [Enterobacter cloacae complex sp. 4DZ1-17B1]|nr:hypothetical protein DD594_25450 [Enterobacter cloacae complex sp. 4DZ1-17B1]
MAEYVNSQQLGSLIEVIHHTMVALCINIQQGDRRNAKPMENKDKMMQRGKKMAKILPKAIPTTTTIGPRRREFTKVKTNSLLKSLKLFARTISVSSVGSKDMAIVLAPRRILAMRLLGLPPLKLQKRMLIAKDHHFPMLGER